MGENSGSSDQAAISAGDTSTCGHLLHSPAPDSMGHMGHSSDPHLPTVPTLTSNNTAPAPGEPFILADSTFGQATLTHLSTGNNTQQITSSSYSTNTNTSNTSSSNSNSNTSSNSNTNNANTNINQQQPQQHPPTALTSTSPPVNPLAYQFSPSSANCSISTPNNPGNIGPVTAASTPCTTSTISGHHNISSASSTASSASGLNTSNSGNSNNNSGNMHVTADYLAQLLKDQKQVSAFPGVFYQVERLLSEEINRVRSTLFQSCGSEKKPLKLPDADGPNISKQDKIYVPVDKHPEYNFVGRILGPRGMTAKQLEQETGCKIMVRGKGSMRDRKKEEQNRGKPNWEHLNEPLHVLITCEDSENRVDIKLARAREEVEKLLVPVADGEDDLKKRQLMELAIINGTYRDSTTKPVEFRCDFASTFDGTEQLKMLPATPILRHMGHPLILSSPQQMLTQHQVLNGTGPQLMAPPEASALIYSRAAYDFGAQYAHNILTTPHLLEFQPGAPNGTVSDISTATPGKQRRPALTTNLREHPYQRPAKAT